jgi:exonuclease III
MLRGGSQPISELSSDLTEGISTRAGSSCHQRKDLVEDKQGEPFNSRSDEERVIFADTEEQCDGKTLAERVGEDQHRVGVANLTDSVVVRQESRVKARTDQLVIPGRIPEVRNEVFGYMFLAERQMPIPEIWRTLRVEIRWELGWGQFPVVKVSRSARYEGKVALFAIILRKGHYHHLVSEMNRFCVKAKLRGATAKVWNRYRPIKAGEKEPEVKESEGKPPPSKPFRLATWNVNGMRDKKLDMERLLDRTGSGVVCFQETLRRADFWKLNLGNWEVRTAARTDLPGERGLALAISPEFNSGSLVQDSANMVSCKVFGGSLSAQVGVIGVYIPCRAGRKAALKKLILTYWKIREANPTLPLVIMGDFNMSPKVAKAWLDKNGLGLMLVANKNNTYFPADPERKPSMIDHIMVSSEISGHVDHVNVLEEYAAVSDHAPLIASLKLERVAKTAPASEVDEFVPSGWRKPWKFKWTKKQDVALVRDNNKWLPLLDLPETVEGVSELAQSFEITSKKVAAEAKFGDEASANPAFAKKSISKKVLKLIKKRSRARKHLLTEIRNGASRSDIAVATKVLRLARSEAAEVARWERRNRWFKTLGKVCGAAESSKGVWRWVKSLSGQNGSTKVAPVLRRDNGLLETNSAAIIEQWEEHYLHLSADISGKSKDFSYWEGKFPNMKEVLTPDDLNRTLSWGEICETMLTHMKTGKAAGFDSISQSWLNLACDEKDPETKEYPEVPASSMGKVMLKLCRTVWSVSTVPECWKSGLLVSLFKKGDPADMNNYRGITLMALGLKVMCCIITRRLCNAIEEKGVLMKAQGGFRPKEEAIAQAITLYEVLVRRLIKGKVTYVSFLDLKKAFDTVPHGALIEKLRALGVKGKILELIRAIYDSSQFRVRIGGKFTGIIQLLRGVRQGCPASPTLFDIFINDILDGTEIYGVSVPGLPNKINGHAQRLSGLMFADDLVVLSSCHASLDKILQKVFKWASKNGMTFGIKKCNVLHFGTAEQQLRSATKPPILMNGEEVKVAHEYKYLGMAFEDKLSLETMVDARVSDMNKKLQAIAPFLRSKCIPIPIRAMVFGGLPLAVGRYGMELFGMKRTLTTKLENVAARGLRWIAGLSKNRRVNLTAIRAELGIISMEASAAQARCRLLTKAERRGLKIWLTDLVKFPLKSRRRTWVSGGTAWLAAYGPCLSWDQQAALAQSDARDGRLMSKYVRNHVEQRAREGNTSRAWLSYSSYQYEESRGYLRWSNRNLELGKAYTSLLQCRTGSFLTAEKLSQMRLILSANCPFCEGGMAEDLHHMFFTCSAWNPERDEFLGPLLPKCQGTEEEQVAILLGGTVGEFNLELKDWVTEMVVEEQSDDKGSFGVDELALALINAVSGPVRAGEAKAKLDIKSQEKQSDPEKVAAPGLHLAVVKFLDGVSKTRAPKLHSSEVRLGAPLEEVVAED